MSLLAAAGHGSCAKVGDGLDDIFASMIAIFSDAHQLIPIGLQFENALAVVFACSFGVVDTV